MSSEWIDTTIGDQVQLQRGVDITKRDFKQGTIPVVSSGGIGGFHDTFTDVAPGVILGRKGLVGSVYYLPTDYWAHDTTLWVKDFKGNHPKYVYYFFRSIAATLRDLDVGSANPTLNRNHVHPIETRWAPIDEQKAIAHILGTLDDKIELNRKTNETLEAMAKALFKSWFVDFDPVRAKAKGRPTGLPAEISDLFPDSFEDSELGEIPKGWEVGSLDQIGINPRETAKPEDMDSSDRYIGLEHMPRGSICLGESGQAEELESNKNRFRKGDLLFGKLRPYFKKTGCSQFDGVCSTDIVVVRKKGEYGVGFICCFLASDPFIDFTVAASSGTRMPRTSWKDMCEFPFAIPSKLLLCEFDKQFCHVINKITGNCIHSAYLAVLRDALLPKLISGELRIPDAEKMLEEAGI
jgi:type I restriction enzyme S subunit